MAWYDEAVFYHIYPLGLCGCAHENDGQPTPGAFAKLEAWAAHAAKLGCTAIYIGPLFESGSHGYDTIDYRLVDRRLGTNEEFKEFVENQGYAFFPMMAAISYQVEPLLKKIQEMLSALPPVERYEPEPVPVLPAEEIGRHDVKITVQDRVYFVEGEWLLQVMKSVNFDDYESLQYFQRVLISSGVIDRLREAGIQEGDTVSIYDVEFDFVN